MTVTDIRTRHSWGKKPRRDRPEHHIYTCRRDTCGLMKRHELVDGVWIWVWRWPDGKEGSGATQPSCGEHSADVAPEGGTDPAPVPPRVDASTTTVPAEAPPCCHHRPPLDPCGLPTRLYTSGWACVPAAVAASRARAEHLAALRSATSGMGVPSWRGEAA